MHFSAVAKKKLFKVAGLPCLPANRGNDQTHIQSLTSFSALPRSQMDEYCRAITDTQGCVVTRQRDVVCIRVENSKPAGLHQPMHLEQYLCRWPHNWISNAEHELHRRCHKKPIARYSRTKELMSRSHNSKKLKF